ncbi:MAG: hypothetical protein R6X02_04025 [Enhygromyxa sp.]
MVFALAISACITDRPAVSRIVDPELPAPVLCFGPLRPCGLPGPNHKTAELIVTATPLASPEPPRVVWYVDAKPGFERGRAQYIRYGVVPAGWSEKVGAEPLQPGMLYEFQNLRFVVKGHRIRRVRRP